MFSLNKQKKRVSWLTEEGRCVVTEAFYFLPGSDVAFSDRGCMGRNVPVQQPPPQGSGASAVQLGSASLT